MSNLHWFRSDLRTQSNPALNHALQHGEGLTKAVFIITAQQWLDHNWGDNKLGFVLANVIALQQELASVNIQLDILVCDWFSAVPDLLLQYATKNKCTHLFFNKEYELNEHERDKKVLQLLTKHGIDCSSFDDQCLIPPGIVLNKQHEPYAVFTAFKKACYQLISADSMPAAKVKYKAPTQKIAMQKLPAAFNKYLANPILDLWPAGEIAAQKYLKKFVKDDLLYYKQQRDFPALDATSKLSAYLAVGAISVQQCFIAAEQANEFMFPGGNPNIICWIDELLWRDFYRNIIFHYPRISKGENYNVKYNKIKWKPAKTNFALWAGGKTGVPIIDAAMRQLVQTGWMHNRLRMITAMFLTKHLLIDWRYGEEFFSQHLVDLDFASNNGGWQWCASTGNDAVPYFRIFNPVTQSERFDANGEFIRKYCPELKGLDSKQIHNPSNYCSAAQLAKMNYPHIIVDLSAARQQALAAFKGV